MEPAHSLLVRDRFEGWLDLLRIPTNVACVWPMDSASPPRSVTEDPGKLPGTVTDAFGKVIRFCGGAGSRTLVKGPNRNETRRGLTQQTHEIVWTSRSRSIPRRPT
jgi:hypothetical protein